MSGTNVSAAFLKKAKAEYDNYVLIEDDYVRESFRVMYENMREILKDNQEQNTKITQLEARIKTLESQ